jgi:hypothetical protein
MRDVGDSFHATLEMEPGTGKLSLHGIQFLRLRLDDIMQGSQAAHYTIYMMYHGALPFE